MRSSGRYALRGSGGLRVTTAIALRCVPAQAVPPDWVEKARPTQSGKIGG